MIRNLAKSTYLLTGMAILLAAFFAAGCTTTAAEKSGRMPNETSNKHVKGYEMGKSQSIKLLLPRSGLGWHLE